MKIIRAGKLPEQREYRTTCRKCQTFFSFLQGEAEYNSDQRDGDFYSISCPLCKNIFNCNLQALYNGEDYGDK